MILIADDDRVFSRLLSAHLQRRGFRVVTAFDSMQAMMIAMHQPVELIILDIAMPGGGGITVLERLKGSLKTNLIPVIVVSASADETVLERARTLGAEDYLSKPVDLVALDKSVDELLNPAAPDAHHASGQHL